MPRLRRHLRHRLIGLTAALTLALAGLFGLGASSASAASATYPMFLTYYGWWDNTPPGGAISYPQIHQTAGGTGTYADPITFATYTGELAPGTRLYVPRVGKYFIMEDSCQECQADWTGHGPNGGPGLRHVDMWLGGQNGDAMKAIECEGALTDYNNDGTPTMEPVVVNPPSNMAVDPMPLFNTSTGQCYDNAQSPAAVGTYKNGANGQCLDDPGDSSTSGVKLVTKPCTGAPEQVFTFQGAFLIRHNLCADYTGGPISLRTCTAGPTQQWSTNPNGTITDIQTGQKCIATSGTNVVAGGCSGTAAQWTFTSTVGSQPDFSVAVSPTSGTVKAGSSTTVSVTTAAQGTPESLGLYVAGFPQGGAGSFSPKSVTAGGGSTLTITTAASTPTGTYPVAVTASGSTGTHTATFNLTVSSGTGGGGKKYEAEASGNTLTGLARVISCSSCSGGARVGYLGTRSTGVGTLTFNGVAASGGAGLYHVTVACTNGSTAARTGQITVNGASPVAWSCPPTGSYSTPTNVVVALTLAAGTDKIAFGNSSKPAPDIDAITVPATTG